MSRKRSAWYSYLALLVGLLGLLAGFLLADPYSNPPAALEPGPLMFLLLAGIHLWYFRREWEEMRLGWVQRRPWLRYFVRTQPQSFVSPRAIALSVGWFALAIVLLSVRLLFIGP